MNPAPTYPPRMPEATPLPGPTTTATVAPSQERLPETGGAEWDVTVAVAGILVVIGLVLWLVAYERRWLNP